MGWSPLRIERRGGWFLPPGGITEENAAGECREERCPPLPQSRREESLCLGRRVGLSSLWPRALVGTWEFGTHVLDDVPTFLWNDRRCGTGNACDLNFAQK